eukprot:364750-Chlamydomonas_euryale.AAC.16
MLPTLALQQDTFPNTAITPTRTLLHAPLAARHQPGAPAACMVAGPACQATCGACKASLHAQALLRAWTWACSAARSTSCPPPPPFAGASAIQAACRQSARRLSKAFRRGR